MWQFSQAVAGPRTPALRSRSPSPAATSRSTTRPATPRSTRPPSSACSGSSTTWPAAPSGWQDQGEHLYLLGTTRDELDGSAWAEAVHRHLGGRPPVADLDGERSLAGLLHAATQGGLVSVAIDLSEGGPPRRRSSRMRAALRRRRPGDRRDRGRATAWTPPRRSSESQGRALVAVPHEEDVKFRGLCEGRGYPVMKIGVTDLAGAEAAIEVQDRFTLPLAELGAAHRETLPARFGLVIG